MRRVRDFGFLGLFAAASAGLLAPPVAAPLAGQSVPVEAGERIRVFAPMVVDGVREGSVVSMDARTIRLRPDGAERPLSVPVSAIARLEVRRQRGSQWGLGLAAGLMAGAGVGALAESQLGGEGAGRIDLGTKTIIGVAAGAGMLIGALVGSNIPRSTWERVPLAEGLPGLLARLRVVSGPAGGAVGVAIRFR